MKVQVLGAGCRICKNLKERIQWVIAINQLNAEEKKVTDLHEIMRYGILMTPGLVVDDDMKSYGSIPKDDQHIHNFLR